MQYISIFFVNKGGYPPCGAEWGGGFNPVTTVVLSDERVNLINPFKPEFITVIFIHYKPKIAVAILDL